MARDKRVRAIEQFCEPVDKLPCLIGLPERDASTEMAPFSSPNTALRAGTR